MYAVRQLVFLPWLRLQENLQKCVDRLTQSEVLISRPTSQLAGPQSRGQRNPLEPAT